MYFVENHKDAVFAQYLPQLFRQSVHGLVRIRSPRCSDLAIEASYKNLTECGCDTVSNGARWRETNDEIDFISLEKRFGNRRHHHRFTSAWCCLAEEMRLALIG